MFYCTKPLLTVFIYVAPIECYIMQGEHSLPHPVIDKFAKTGGALSKNVFLLRMLSISPCFCMSDPVADFVRIEKSGLVTTAHGLRVACLGGIFDEKLYHIADSPHVCPSNPTPRLPTHSPKGFTSPYFTSHTMEKLFSNSMTQTPTSATRDASFGSLATIKASTSHNQLVDILLSNTFPSNITALSSAPCPTSAFPSEGSEPVAELSRRVKPRYHFVVGKGGLAFPMFWEREPFTWPDECDRISRFVSLGAFGGEQNSTAGKKQRVRPFVSFLCYFHVTNNELVI